MATSGQPSSETLPNLIVVGAMKCGTSSMHAYLDAHPDIAMSREKEINFFSFDRYWELGPTWYGRHFSSSAIIRGESSPSYSKFPHRPNVPERIKTLIPDTKLIYLVRDPIERIISHYMHVRATGREDRSISEALSSLENNPYVDTSRYFMQIERYLRHFSESSILIVDSGDLRNARNETLRRVFRFLGVDDTFRSSVHDSVYHVSGQPSLLTKIVRRHRLARSLLPYVPRIIFNKLSAYETRRRSIDPPFLSDALRSELRAYLLDDIRQFRQTAGQKFATWSV